MTTAQDLAAELDRLGIERDGADEVCHQAIYQAAVAHAIRCDNNTAAILAQVQRIAHLNRGASDAIAAHLTTRGTRDHEMRAAVAGALTARAGTLHGVDDQAGPLLAAVAELPDCPDPDPEPVPPPQTVRGVLYTDADLARIDITKEPWATGYRAITTKGKNDGVAGVRDTRRLFGGLGYLWWHPGPVVNVTDFTQVRDDSVAIATQALLSVVGPLSNRAAHRAAAIAGLDIVGRTTGYDQATGQGKLERSWVAHNHCVAIDLLGVYDHPAVDVLADQVWPMMYHTNSENWVLGMAEVRMFLAVLTGDDQRWKIATDQYLKALRSSMYHPAYDPGGKVRPMFSEGLNGTPMIGNTQVHWRRQIDTQYLLSDPQYRGIPGLQTEDFRDPGHLCISLAVACGAARCWLNHEGALPQEVIDRLVAGMTRAAARARPLLEHGTMATDPSWTDGDGGNSTYQGWLQCARFCDLVGIPVPADLAAICARPDVAAYGSTTLNMTLTCLTDAR